MDWAAVIAEMRFDLRVMLVLGKVDKLSVGADVVI